MPEDARTLIIKALALQRGMETNVALVKEEFLKSQDPQVVVRTFEELDKRVNGWMYLGSSAAHGLALDLSQVEDIWDLLPTEYTSRWNYSFKDYATDRTGMNWLTVYNHINMARTFLTGKVELPGKPKGFQPLNIPHAKLILATHAAKAGKLDEMGWSKLMDNDVGWEEFRDEIHKVRLLGSGKQTGQPEPKKKYTYFFIEDDLLWYSEGDHRITIGHLDSDPQFDTQEENDLAKKGVARAKLLLHVKESNNNGNTDF